MIPATITELEPNARYRVLVEGRRDPVTGKRRYLHEIVTGSRCDAERAAERLVASPASAYAFFAL